MDITKEDKIIRAFENKTWQEIKVKDSWQIFKVMSEFVDGLRNWQKLAPVFQYLDQHVPRANTNIIKWQ